MPLEYTIADPPKEPISSLAFNPNTKNAHQLLVASWDKTVRLYNLCDGDQEQQQSSKIVHTFAHEAAVLDVCWITDTLAASACLDRRVRLLNLQTGQANIIGKHDDAVSRIRYSTSTNLLITCSWDATIKVWNPSVTAATLLTTIPLPDKALAMDVTQNKTPRLVVGLAGRIVHIYNLNSFASSDVTKPEQRRESSLKFMLRDLRCMPSGEGFAISSVEGRIAVELFDPSPAVQANKYAFKCHRQSVDGVDTVYPVNAMAFHPVHGTFASLGGDGVWSVWDAAAKKRIRQYPRLPAPLSAGAMSSDGTLQAVACGFEDVGPVQIHIRNGALDECKPKAC